MEIKTFLESLKKQCQLYFLATGAKVPGILKAINVLTFQFSFLFHTCTTDKSDLKHERGSFAFELSHLCHFVETSINEHPKIITSIVNRNVFKNAFSCYEICDRRHGSKILQSNDPMKQQNIHSSQHCQDPSKRLTYFFTAQ